MPFDLLGLLRESLFILQSVWTINLSQITKSLDTLQHEVLFRVSIGIPRMEVVGTEHECAQDTPFILHTVMSTASTDVSQSHHLTFQTEDCWSTIAAH
eukprot:m.192772 g.192772  ORF g.192772 m.192772 type:complete len:98 (-) comp24961_c0_seq1:2064-2357(-)